MMNILDNKPNNFSASLSGLACAALMCSFSIFAEESQNTAVDDKWYVGSPLAEIAPSTSKEQDKDNTSVSVTNVAVDESRNGWKINVEFDLSEHFAIGAAYVDLEDVDLDVNKAEQQMFSPSRKIMHKATDGFTLESSYHYNLSDNIGLSGSVGLFNWQGDVQTQSLNSNTSNSGTDVYFGLGGGYQLSEDVTLKINWERYQLKDEATQMWSIGLNYHFK